MHKHIKTRQSLLSFKFYIVCFALTVIGILAHAQKANLQINSTPMKIDTLVKLLVERDNFSGTILFAEHDKISYFKSFGLADREKNKKNSNATLYDIGSLTKQFTASAVLILVQRKKLSLSATLNQFFENIPQDKSGITLHQLLTHSAGFNDAMNEDDAAPLTKHDFIQQAFQTKLLFEPGTDYSYSNTGYTILAVIIEKVSGVSYEQFLRTHLFIPAHMKSTGYVLQKPERRFEAVGYNAKDERLGKPTDQNWTKDGPSYVLIGNGGIITNASDLYKWYQELTNGKLLTAESKKLLFTPFVKEGKTGKTFYGYGWSLYPQGDNTYIIKHNGSNGYFYADLLIDSQRSIAIILLSNHFKPKFSKIAQQISKY